jgi:hypothetical protein
MRRREKFVIASILISIGLWVMQYVSLEWRYLAVGILTLLTYFISAWVLSDDLQRHEWLTVVPFPALYTGAIGLFYFLLPSTFVSRVVILAVSGVGVYALYLTSNIYSVAKGRSIQLLHAAHAIGFLFTLLTSVLVTNTLFSLRFPWFINGLGVALIHLPLVMMSLWSIELEPRLPKQVVWLSAVVTLLLAEIAIILSFLPLSVWNISLFIMAFLYVALGVLHNYLHGRLFSNTMTEYSLVAGFVLVLFVVLFPLK